MLELKPVKPVGREKTFVLGQRTDGTPFYHIDMDIYPDCPEARELRDLRVRRRLGVRQAARRLGIPPSKLYGLESGRYTCDWEEAKRLLWRGDVDIEISPIVVPEACQEHAEHFKQEEARIRAEERELARIVLVEADGEIDRLKTVCTVHGDVEHGGEAEELRAGIEALVQAQQQRESTIDELIEKLQRLLDEVDTRDSLVWVEGREWRVAPVAKEQP